MATNVDQVKARNADLEANAQQLADEAADFSKKMAAISDEKKNAEAFLNKV